MPFSNEAQQNPNSYAHHTIDLAKQVRDSGEYALLRGHHTPHPLAFQYAAETLANNEFIGAPDRALLLTTAKIGGYIEAQHQLDRMRQEKEDGHYFPEDEWQKLNNLIDEYAIPFNHELKEFVNTHPNDQLHIVGVALATAYQTIFGRYQTIDSDRKVFDDKPSSSDVLHHIENALNGMRHEVAAEALLQAARYPFRYDVSVSEDASGSDLFVRLANGQWVGVDSKASPAGVHHSRAKHRSSKAVWTGLDQGDFTGQRGTTPDALSIPYAVALEKSSDFISRIEKMVAHNEDEERAIAKHAVSQTVRRR